MRIEKLGIKFPDNDYFLTFRTILDLFADKLNFHTDYQMEYVKSRIRDRVNASSKGICEIVQARNIDDNLQKFVDGYLKIELENIFINDEVDNYIENCEGWDNCEFHVLYLKCGCKPYTCSI